MEDKGLFDRIAAHRVVFFRYTWMDYSTMRPGTLRVVPVDEQRDYWEKDYKAMQEEMFFGTRPSFSEVLNAVETFEREFNSSAPPPMGTS